MEFTSQRVDKTTTKFAPKLKPKAPVKKPAASPRLTPATPGNAGTPLVESLPPASQESVLPTLSTQPDLPPTPLTLPSITITAPPHGAASDVQKSPRKTSPLRNRAPSPPKLVIPPPASPTRISDGFAASQESMILVSPRPSDDRSSKASQTQPGRTGTAHESETKLPTSPSQSQAKKNVSRV
ncbi:uncharacterized protein BJ171DRAFT_50919 [Polychytrium aggregatum]|uniref:uncharacterized protein n=1 Tax=Polychytrium aggregatum TaxID=110093 RepID=UPI0022FE4B98|nr:uncharacterized protein BJ171DRAFT_50919 [Polychytrium aggregatum]KAI9205713.1 hypothetical protein BJ171DRAFT_50919 [Polychytrium aggregatum]